MSTSTQAFGTVVRELRERQGLSQEALARKVPGLSQTYISQLELGKIDRPSPERAHDLADALGVDANWLMVKAGYLRAEVPSGTPISDIEGDLLAFAQDRPDMMTALRKLRDENTEEAYRTALKLIHRSIISSIEAARDLFPPKE